MKPDPKKSVNPQWTDGAKNPETPEPTAGLAPTPVWLIFLFALLFYWAQLYLDQHGGGFHPQVYEPYQSFKQLADLRPKDETQMLLGKGKAHYENVCKGCHQENGMGSPGQFPPLVGSEWVTGVPERLIRIPIHGLSGPIQVNGVDWPPGLSMPAIGAALPPEDLAALLSYVRNAWGNKASIIKPEQVKAVFESTANRTQPWTSQELLQVQASQ
jgi:mono/diheme cytochrome c family protein